MLSRTLFVLALPLVSTSGSVEEVTSEPQFKKILKENQGVVVDFYSQSCGPCIMMAPVYKDLAREMPELKFIKVDVQRSHVGVQIRSMPTFHSYLQGNLLDQFSGAGEGQLRQMAQVLARKVEEMDILVSLGDLENFYQEHDPSKLDKVDEHA
jgi:thioredoxin 1